MIARSLKTASISRLKLAAANARAVLALSDMPTYSVAKNKHGEWSVESIHDVGFSASGMYHHARESAELELEFINCTDYDKAVELELQLLNFKPLKSSCER